jgi:diguanylate cyclase (GGDEF)-like protein
VLIADIGRNAPRGGEACSGHPVDQGEQLRVLIADDDPGVRALLRFTVEAEGFVAVEAADGVAALAILRAGLVDLALLDLRMPGMSGEQVLANATDIAGEVPVIMLTGSERSRALIGLRLGAHDYIVKPFDPAELSSRVLAAARVREAFLRGRARRQTLVQQLEQAERVALSDELTGLANRRLLQRALNIAAERSARDGEPFSVVIVDIDDFKAINDNNGHDVGDQVLQRVGLEIARALREEDVPGRWGGDEFLAVLPATPADVVMAAVARIRLALSAAPFPVPVTTTMGVATGIGPVDVVVRAADQALLTGKREGKGGVRIALPALV